MTIPIPPQVLWHEGMLLLPQHFQQESLHQQLLLNYRLQTATPYAYGVRRLAIDHTALVNGQFRIQSLEAVMPDGLVVDYVAGQTDLDLSIDLQAEAENLRAAPVRIYLVIPDLAASLSRSGGQGELPRFRALDGEPVTDIVSGESIERIGRVAPNVSIIATNQPSRKFVALPIAEVHVRDETFDLTSYVPPSLGLHRSSALGRECNALAQRLREKVVFLADRYHGLYAAQREAEAEQTRLTIAALSANLPRLETLLASEANHPFAVYQVLAGMAGAMAPASASLVPPTLRGYAHEEIRACFDEVLRFIITSLDSIQVNYLTIAFQTDQAAFSLRLRPEWMTRNLIVGARIPPGVRDEDMVQWMSTAVIASREQIDSLRERRVLGAPRVRITRDAGLDIVQTGHSVLFAIRVDRDTIYPEEELVVTNFQDRMAASQPLELVLYVKRDGGGS